jgi:peptidoglycan hydrolase-like protein with peptidoglycan-binding domain
MFATDRSSGSRYIAGRHVRKIAAVLAVALTTAITLTGAAAITAPEASAATACVYQNFGYSNTYQTCVLDEQVLLNDLWRSHVPGPNQLLATDGYYGSHTESDVGSFNNYYGVPSGDVTTGGFGNTTWEELCYVDFEHGYTGAYWQGAGCAVFI